MTESSNSPRQLDAAATAAALPFASLVRALALAADQLAAGDILCPARLVTPLTGGGTLLSMPAIAADVIAHKLIAVVPGNVARGLPTITGQLSVLDGITGECRLLLDGAEVTGRRTAAMSMLGIETLAGSIPSKVLLIGTGAQARHHAHALVSLYPEIHVEVLGHGAGRAKAFCAALNLAQVRPAPPLGSSTASVVITCTTSTTPVYSEPARTDRLVVAVGAYRAHTAEIAAATVNGSRIVVDDLIGARHEAGDLLLASCDWGQVRNIADARQTPRPPHAAWLFKSVGCAAWDLAAARVALAQLKPGGIEFNSSVAD